MYEDKVDQTLLDIQHKFKWIPQEAIEEKVMSQ